MEQILSWKADMPLGSQYIPRILWNSKVYYFIQERSPFVPILNEINSVSAFTVHFLKIHFNITFQSMPRVFQIKI
jgi:hypothetical protein